MRTNTAQRFPTFHCRVSKMRRLFLLMAFSQLLSANAFTSIRHYYSADIQSQSKTQLFYSSERKKWIGPKFQVSPTELSEILQSLESRKWQLRSGIGKRFRCRARENGFWRIHESPTLSPGDTRNVVGAINDGDVITTIGPPVDDWIHHSRGWSLRRFDGVEWLEELEE